VSDVDLLEPEPRTEQGRYHARDFVAEYLLEVLSNSKELSQATNSILHQLRPGSFRQQGRQMERPKSGTSTFITLKHQIFRLFARRAMVGLC
jgi:hypothetical protein